jgi:DNA-binding LacI/PurR family transcriptional regulator
MAKYAQFTAILEKRIRRGDYAITGLPTEQELAAEIGVSRMTARRVLLQLMDRGVLERKPHGRLSVTAESQSDNLRIAFLAPAYSSPDFEAWRNAVERAAKQFDAVLRMVEFVHWDDPVISQTLTEFAGVFLVPNSEPLPGFVRERLSQAKNVVVLDGDMTDCGLPSVELIPPIAVHKLADHLLENGHKRIACLNTQPRDAVIAHRIEQWLFWQKMHHVEGRLIDTPVEPYSNPTPRAYRTMDDLLKRKEFTETALICITEPAAVGAIRALHEHGLTAGVDVAICSMDGSGMAQYMVPSRTCLQPPDPSIYLDVCMEWFKRAGEPWVGPLLIQPGKVSLLVGESSGWKKKPAGKKSSGRRG